jgi:hypothetical protein
MSLQELVLSSVPNGLVIPYNIYAYPPRARRLEDIGVSNVAAKFVAAIGLGQSRVSLVHELALAMHADGIANEAVAAFASLGCFGKHPSNAERDFKGSYKRCVCVCVCVRQLPTNCAPRQPAANHSGRPPAACLHQAASFQPLAPSPRQPLTAYSRQPTAVARAQTNWQPPTSRKPPHSSPAQVAAARVPALPPITGRQATVIRDAKSWRLRGG